MSPTRRLAFWVWLGAISVASLVVFAVAVQQPGSSGRVTSIAVGSWFPAVVTLLGILITTRRAENRIAWLLIAIGFSVLVEYFLQLSLVSEPIYPSILDLVAIMATHVTLPLALYFLFLIAFLFPEGRFFSPGQAWAVWPGAIMLFTQLLITIFAKEIGPPYPSEEQGWTVANPVGFLPSSVLKGSIALTLTVLSLTAIGGGFSLVMRYRRSSLVPRAQIRWMLLSTMIVVIALTVVATTNASRTMAGGLLLQIAFVSIPISITIAITRYQLFEIDRIISRTISYTAVASILGLVYAFGAIWLPTRVLGDDVSPVFVASSTLAVAALFTPLRKRVQRAVDRRFNRTAVHTEAVSEVFATQVSESLTVDQLVDRWQSTVNQYLQPTASGIWLVHGDGHGE